MELHKIKLEILGISTDYLNSNKNSYIVILEEENSSRKLPIIIGVLESEAILIEMGKIPHSRPTTHDLFKSTVLSFDIEVEEIIISDLKEGVFYAKMMWRDKKKGKCIKIDARPSDAIAMAVRFNAPVYAVEKVMNEAAIDDQDIEQEEDMDKEIQKIKPQRYKADVNKLVDKSIKELQEMIEQAIEAENYEIAAKIRDEINKR